MQDEVKSTALIAVGLSMLASLLMFVTFLMMMRSEVANIRNTEISAKQAIKDMYEFNLYHDSVLYGEDVVAAIRNYADTNVRIAVNSPTVSVAVSCAAPPHSYVSVGYYEVDNMRAKDCSGLLNTTYLRGWFPTTHRYRAVLVYGGVDLKSVTPSWRQDGVYSNVTGIVFFYDGLRTN